MFLGDGGLRATSLDTHCYRHWPLPKCHHQPSGAVWPGAIPYPSPTPALPNPLSLEPKAFWPGGRRPAFSLGPKLSSDPVPAGTAFQDLRCDTSLPSKSFSYFLHLKKTITKLFHFGKPGMANYLNRELGEKLGENEHSDTS